MKVEIEYRFKYNETTKVADIAYLDENKELINIIEIYNTHHIDDKDRPEPWYEIRALDIIELKEEEDIELECIRNYTCDECKKERYNELNKMEIDELIKDENKLDWYIRYQLGIKLGDEDIINQDIIQLFKKFYKNKIVMIRKKDNKLYINFMNTIKTEGKTNLKLMIDNLNLDVNNKLDEDSYKYNNPNKVFVNMGCY